ncbi:MAG: hydroxylamine reductase [Candidatus Methanomethyliaceae archaeon]|nr:hydroxylamine reductase [Candidatus Methanomethyliaceae archaeon]
MFCLQCEQTAKGQGCTTMGVCGKNPEVSALQDLLIYSLRGLAQVILDASKRGIYDESNDFFICKALFSTLTNVNFDPKRISNYILEAISRRDKLKEKIKNAGIKYQGPADLKVEKNEIVKQAFEFFEESYPRSITDKFTLQYLLTLGLKGISAYAYHAYRLGKKDYEIFRFIDYALTVPINDGLSVDDLLNLNLKCGEINLRTMEILDAANTESYGHPLPTKVNLGAKKGKAILVSGHDLKDLEELLKQTQNMGIYVYTHGEMLPAHGYPKLKSYPHLYGHYGTAWQNQRREFDSFPGSILITTNCLMPPLESYSNKIFTTGPVGAPGITHITNGDFSPLIKRALELPGFIEDVPGRIINVGFARNAILSIGDKIIKALSEGKIRHIFLVGGCDGAKPIRNYYNEFVEKTPKDTLILTLACGKFRFFDKELGEIDGIPRLLDIGQCNDAYSAIKVAQALSSILKIGVNELPLSLVISWFEQKAIAILLSLLYLGIKNIIIGPSLPAFLTPNILKLLAEKYNIRLIGKPDEDLKAILGRA